MPVESLSTAALFGQPPPASFRVRDRIKALVRVPAGELLDNPKNWRRHPKGQAAALRGLLTEIGYADALLARELPSGRLMLIDGHLRKETTPEAVVPGLVLDLDESEADKLLLTLDPLAAMAESDADRIKELLETVQTDDGRVAEAGGRRSGLERAASGSGTARTHRQGGRAAAEVGDQTRPTLADW